MKFFIALIHTKNIFNIPFCTYAENISIAKHKIISDVEWTHFHNYLYEIYEMPEPVFTLEKAILFCSSGKNDCVNRERLDVISRFLNLNDEEIKILSND